MNRLSRQVSNHMRRYAAFHAHFVFLNFCLASFSLGATGTVTPQQSTQGQQDILHYIASGWDFLTRSMTKCETVSDPKTREKSVVYLEFLSMVLENFRRDGTIREKYNVVTRSSETRIKVGYTENVTGFGRTNAAFLELLHALPKELSSRLEVK